jgi:hypothetical protein
MPDVAERLRTFLIAGGSVTAIVAQRVHQGVVPESSEPPFIWYRRARTDEPRTLDGGSPSGFEQYFDIECVSEDLGEAQALAYAVRDRLNNYRGSFADSTVKGIFVEDHSDDYVPRSVSSDDVAHVAALSVQIIP